MTAATNHKDLRQDGLTARQLLILRYVAYCIRTGRPPTIRAIGEEFRIASPNGVMTHLRALERKGFIEIDPNTARGVRLAGVRFVQFEYEDSEAGRRLRAQLERDDVGNEHSPWEAT